MMVWAASLSVKLQVLHLLDANLNMLSPLPPAFESGGQSCMTATKCNTQKLK